MVCPDRMRQIRLTAFIEIVFEMLRCRLIAPDRSRSRVTKILDEVFELLGEEKPDERSRRSELVVKYKETPLYQFIADDVMELFDQKLKLGQITDELKIDRNTVTSLVKFWHERCGLLVPDGRTRRKSL